MRQAVCYFHLVEIHHCAMDTWFGCQLEASDQNGFDQDVCKDKLHNPDHGVFD